ncbi:low temperature requirement protein A [Streptacidiphilus rugosus]|uniref:low temperature requirement protein A n=1 Tax=Streptacidiphilus rugosus TaxID=405783 RepID=UPI0005623C4A|nr:low temperature requirement protein A [Streptacidiphilus rugosus]
MDWFELFFDLGFAAVVGSLASGLRGDPGPGAFGAFLVLSFPAWWAWVHLTVTVNLLGGPERPWVQLVLLAAMPPLALMAAAEPKGLGANAWAYAFGAAGVRLVLFALWWHAATREGSPLRRSRPVLQGLVTAGLWALSAAVPGAARFALWGAAMLLEVVLLHVRTPVSERLYESLAVEHLVERFGGLVVIVLGESVLTVVGALQRHFTWSSALAALLALATVTLLAFAFFVWGTSRALLRLTQAQQAGNSRAVRDTVVYLPFLLISAITMMAAGLGTAVTAPGHPLASGARWAVGAGISGFYLARSGTSLRHGEPVPVVLRRAAPGVVLPLVLIPLGAVVPAWVSVAGAALVVGVMDLVSQGLSQRRG